MKKPTKKHTTSSVTSDEMKAEATRYINNASAILKEKGQFHNGRYTDKKYVKLASHAAYTGVLLALDAVLHLPKKQRNDIKEYHKQLSAMNRKMNDYLEDVYQILHLQGAYDGYGHKETLRIGFTAAHELIDWCVNRVAKNAFVRCF